MKTKPPEITELYEEFEDKLSKEFNDLEIKYLVDAVSIKSQNEFICHMDVKNSIKIQYYTKELDDDKNKTRDISSKTTGGPNSHYELTLDYNDIDYAINLFR